MSLKCLNSRSIALMVIVFLSFVSIALSQELRLFEETESSNNGIENQGSQTVRRDGDGNLVTGPEFTLVGTTRIGGHFMVVIEDRGGEIISVSMPEGKVTGIPGYPGFYVVSAGSGNASIKYPAGLACAEFRSQGVTCEAADTSVLRLANAVPLPGLTSGSSDLFTNTQEGGESNAINPFEALLERAANPDSTTETSAFEPVRINPEDVPPGMRVVSTPFGDRLVEDN